MATNENVNKVIYGNQTVMDITDTTAEESDVASGEVFYKADGARSVGTLNADSAVWGNISGTLSDQTDLQNALNAKQNTLTLPLSTANGGTGNANGYIRTGRKSDTTIGYYATAEGYNTTASGISSHAEGEESIASSAMAHAEGYTTTASGRWSHAEGYQAVASGDRSHAEGYSTTASGEGSHSEGYRTVASGSYSHAEGEATTAGYSHQHVQGVYNDNKSTTLFEVGNGTANNARSNAFEVCSDGHINVNGDIYQNGKLYNDKATQGLLKSTVGWTGKNVLKNEATSRTLNGVTFTVNTDGSVTANGTATANTNFNLITNGTTIADGLLLSGCNGGSISTYYIRAQIGSDYKSVYDGESVPLSNGTLTNIWIGIVNGQTVNNVTFYPMLRDASITDDTYEPYYKPVSEWVDDKVNDIYGVMGVNGAVNRIESVVLGIYKNSSFGMDESTVYASCKAYLEKGTYKISFDKNVNLNRSIIDGVYSTIGLPGNVKYFEFTTTVDGYIGFSWRDSTSSSTDWDLSSPVMIKDIRITNDTYVPYAMTNRELTEEKLSISELKTIASSAADFAAFKTAIANL